MKTTKWIGSFLLLVILGSCGKDKYETTPTITIKEANPDVVDAPNGTLRFIIESTDKEGDEGGGILTYIRVRTSLVPIPNPGLNDKADTVRMLVPNFPKTSKKDLEVSVIYDFLNEHPNLNDTMYFRFTLQDLAGNNSDTLDSKIIVARQE